MRLPLQLFWQLFKRDLAERYTGSLLGMVWSLLIPLAMLVVFTFVFGVIFQARWSGSSSAEQSLFDFAIALFIGFIMYTFVAEVLTRSPTVILQKVSYIKNIQFPVYLLPLVNVASGFYHFLLAFSLVILALLVSGHQMTWHAFLFFVPLIPLVLIAIGLGWFLAAAGVYVRDVQQIVIPLSQFLLFLSPVFYSLTAIPEKFRFWFSLNPLAHSIEAMRAILLYGSIPNWQCIFWLTIGSIAFAYLAWVWFRLAAKGFADVL